jgi:hypothetical protein
MDDINPMALAGARSLQDQQDKAIDDTPRIWPHNALLMEDDQVCMAVLNEIGQPRQMLRPLVTLIWRVTGRTHELIVGDDVAGVVIATAPKSSALQCDRCEAVSPASTVLVVPFAPRLVALVVCNGCRDQLTRDYQPITCISLPDRKE